MPGFSSTRATLPLNHVQAGVALHARVELFQPSGRADVDIEDGDRGLRVERPDVAGVLDGCRAADRRTVRQMVLVARAGALHEGHRVRLLAVGRAQDAAGGGPVRRGHPLQHDVRDHVAEFAEAQVHPASKRRTASSRWRPHRRHLELSDSRAAHPGRSRRYVQASSHAWQPLGAGVAVDRVERRIGHAVRQVGRLGVRQAVIEFVRPLRRAGTRAGAAQRAGLG